MPATKIASPRSRGSCCKSLTSLGYLGREEHRHCALGRPVWPCAACITQVWPGADAFPRARADRIPVLGKVLSLGIGEVSPPGNGLIGLWATTGAARSSQARTGEGRET